MSPTRCGFIVSLNVLLLLFGASIGHPYLWLMVIFSSAAIGAAVAGLVVRQRRIRHE